MFREFSIDLHIHTCLSPCGESSMIPPAIAARARECGLDAIGISDHNSSGNVQAVRAAAEELDLPVLGGMEITSSEEIHVLAFLADPELAALQSIINEHLPGENNSEIWGRQYLVDKEGYVTGEESRLLIGATTLSLGRIVEYIHELNGIAIASHIDKTSFSILSQLGFIPAESGLDGLEISAFNSHRAEEYRIYGLPLVTFSDAHFPGDIGSSRTTLYAAGVSLEEFKKGLAQRDGRTTRPAVWKN